ncbi:MAG: arginine deiminase [Mycoplasma sp.]|nr:arginine deiminase [Candidatus Hennigella equi]
MFIKRQSPIQVFSEIGRLKTVLVKRPGEELSHISPSNMEELLFSAILDWKRAGREHDEFTKILRENGVDVVYLEDLLVETWRAMEKQDKLNFIHQFVDESGVTNPLIQMKIFNFLSKRSVRGMFEAMIKGITKFDLGISLARDVLVTQPMPNLYFTRDNFSSVGNGVILSQMKYKTRQRETIFSRLVFKFHPVYKHTPIYYDSQKTKATIEGGDVFIYNNKTLVIGVSDRTQKESIMEVARMIQKEKGADFDTIIGVNVPHKWNLMHLDTWLTMVDHNKFLYSPNIAQALKFWKIDLTQKKLRMVEHNTTLEDMIESIIHVRPTLIPVADNYSQEKVDIETHFDATNFLVIKPGLVIGYDRNVRTVQALRNAGVEVLTFDGNQLSLGMGSARCMSMPLYREPISFNAFSGAAAARIKFLKRHKKHIKDDLDEQQ